MSFPKTLFLFLSLSYGMTLNAQSVEVSYSLVEDQVSPEKGYEAHHYFSYNPSNPGWQLLINYQRLLPAKSIIDYSSFQIGLSRENAQYLGRRGSLGGYNEVEGELQRTFLILRPIQLRKEFFSDRLDIRGGIYFMVRLNEQFSGQRTIQNPLGRDEIQLDDGDDPVSSLIRLEYFFSLRYTIGLGEKWAIYPQLMFREAIHSDSLWDNVIKRPRHFVFGLGLSYTFVEYDAL